MSVNSGLVAAVLIFVGSGGARAQVNLRDIPPGHWAFEAVQHLASDGLVKGYPPDRAFLGARALTRFEMAVLLKRILDRLDDIIRTPVPRKPAVEEDLGRFRTRAGVVGQLADEFKTQLAQVGADTGRISEDIKSLRSGMSDVEVRLQALDHRTEGLTEKASQSAINSDRAAHALESLRNDVNDGLSKKADIGAGRIRIRGSVQVWYGTAFGEALGGNSPANSGPTPQGRNYGGGVGDTFRLRRAKLAIEGAINDRVDYRTMLDFTRSGDGPGGPLQDLWVGYKLNRYLRLEVGQQKTGLSEEGQREDSQLLTIARSVMNEDLPVTAGRIGNIRDTGAVLKVRTPRISGAFGIWHDNGANTNTVDRNRTKFVTGSVFVSTLRHFTVGLWGGTNIGGSRNDEIRDRAGGTFLFRGGPHTLEIEGAYARDIAAGTGPDRPGSIALGWYGVYAYRLTRRWELVGRFNEWDPAQRDRADSMTESGVFIRQGDHKLKEYTLGAAYYLSNAGSKIQVNYIREDVEVNGTSFFGVPRTILLTSFQTVF